MPSDNITLPGTGQVVRTVANGSVETQVMKLDVGGESSESLVTSANPMPVLVATGGSTVVAGQMKVATAGTAQALPTATLLNGITVTAYVGNAGIITLGNSAVNNTITGTGNGVRLQPGQSFSFSVSNANDVYFNGTVAGDSIDYGGN